MKKKNYLLGALAAGMLLFTACSNEDDVTTGNGNEDAAQAFVLQVASSGDGMTRAGRPMLGSEAKQDIQTVKLIICDGTNVKFVKDITGWNENSTAYTTGGHGRQAIVEIPTANKLEPGTYTVYAFGYSDDSDYDLTAITSLTDGATSGTFNANTTLAFKNNATNTVGEEIFAGSLELSVTAGKGFKQPIVLNRQVAGTYGYVNDIPYIEGATKLQLVASDRNQQLVLGNFANFDLTGNGTGNGENVQYVVNGQTSNDSKVIYTINLTDWFEEIKDGDSDGLIDAADNWKAPADASYADKYFKTGSVFAGEFLIPFAKVDKTQTFTLELTKADGTTVLRSWNVNLPTSDGQLKEYSFDKWDSSAFTTIANMQDTKNTYNVVRNHLYGIGTRTLDNPPTTPGGTDPDPGVDDPESLNNKQELVLRVNDNWEVIHGMELE